MNRLYQTYKVACLNGSAPDLLTAAIKWVLVDAQQYTPNTLAAGHSFLSDIPAGARTAITAALTAKTITDGFFNAADPELPDTGGVQSEYLILFEDTGVETTSRLILFVDTATGLPITPDSTQDTIQHSASGIFAL